MRRWPLAVLLFVGLIAPARAEVSNVEACLLAAADVYRIPPATLFILLQVERGQLGQREPEHERHRRYRADASQRDLAAKAGAHWRSTPMEAYHALRDSFCANVEGGAWILRQALDEAHGDFWDGVGRYHSHDPGYKSDYLRKVLRQVLRLQSRVKPTASAMSAAPRQPDDNAAFSWCVVAIGVLIAGYFGWTEYHAQIVAAVLAVQHWHVWLIGSHALDSQIAGARSGAAIGRRSAGGLPRCRPDRRRCRPSSWSPRLASSACCAPHRPASAGTSISTTWCARRPRFSAPSAPMSGGGSGWMELRMASHARPIRRCTITNGSSGSRADRTASTKARQDANWLGSLARAGPDMPTPNRMCAACSPPSRCTPPGTAAGAIDLLGTLAESLSGGEPPLVFPERAVAAADAVLRDPKVTKRCAEMADEARLYDAGADDRALPRTAAGWRAGSGAVQLHQARRSASLVRAALARLSGRNSRLISGRCRTHSSRPPARAATGMPRSSLAVRCPSRSSMRLRRPFAPRRRRLPRQTKRSRDARRDPRRKAIRIQFDAGNGEQYSDQQPFQPPNLRANGAARASGAQHACFALPGCSEPAAVSSQPSPSQTPSDGDAPHPYLL